MQSTYVLIVILFVGIVLFLSIFVLSAETRTSGVIWNYYDLRNATVIHSGLIG